MSVSICVPFMEDRAERSRNWTFLRERYEAQFPDWEIVVGTCERPWKKGIAVNTAVQASSGDVLVISDADVMVAEHALRSAVEALETAPWAVPHRMVYRLNEQATQAVIADQLLMDPAPVREVIQARLGPSGGGLVVARREDVEAVKGIDERFEGWGGEDISFGWALDTLIGPHLRLDSAMWHLNHPPMPGRGRIRNQGSAESEALVGQYLGATGNPVAMQELLDERPHFGSWGGGVVVMPREAFAEVPLDPTFEGWGHEDHSWGVALFAVLGDCWRGEDPLVHLWHPPAERLNRKKGSGVSNRRYQRYCEARSNPDEMKQFLEEARVALAVHQQTLLDPDSLGVRQ
jgi:hypothetical protein